MGTQLGLKDHVHVIEEEQNQNVTALFLSDFIGESWVNIYYSGHTTREFLKEL